MCEIDLQEKLTETDVTEPEAPDYHQYGICIGCGEEKLIYIGDPFGAGYCEWCI